MRIPGHKIVLAAAACALGSGSAVAGGAADALSTVGAQAGAGDVSLHGVDLEHSTILEIQHAMDRGQISSLSLTVFYLDRIFQLNPSLNAVITTSPTALLEAVFSDVRRQTHQLRGPMDGIPVLLKDNVDTQVMPTTAGSEA